VSERFPADWLALREPVDHRSRAHHILTPLVSWLGTAGSSREDETLRIVDVGSGTGSNMRYLAPRLPEHQAWTLVDHDRALLRRAVESAPRGIEVATRILDLAGGDRTALGRAVVPADSDAPPTLVTASALFDLVSGTWLRDLAGVVAESGAAALFALSYDGSIEWGRPDPEDETVRRAVNAHQRRDKGFGAALGPDAGAAIEVAFRREGYRTWSAPSPWHIGPSEGALRRELVAGWATAAGEECPEGLKAIEAWARRRADGTDLLTVGHLDVLALPG
jgi:SAM-dependent methyltransferase